MPRFYLRRALELPLPISGTVMNPAHRLLLCVTGCFRLGPIHNFLGVVGQLRLFLIRGSSNKNDDGLIAAADGLCA